MALFGAVAWAAVATAPASADEAEWLFDPAAVVEIDFGLPPAARTALEAEPDEYVPAALRITAPGRSYGPYEVGIRLKGSIGSFRLLTGKAAFKVKLDEFVDDQTLFGLERLTLNNMVQDPSMVHETLAYDLFRAIGVPASRTGYAFVRVNGEPYGVYLNVETLDKVSLPRWFASTQHLYEANVPGADVAPEHAGGFEVDRGDDEDLSDLEALIAAAGAAAGDWSDGLAAVADLGEMTRMWAVERYVGHWDGYAGLGGPNRPNNYYLHSLDSGVFQMVPWGTDQAWGIPVEFGEPAGGLLFNKCLADATCEALYEGALGEIASTAPGLDLATKAICTAELLHPWQEMEDPQRREHDAKEIAAGVEDTRAFIARRPVELAEWLGAEAAAASDVDGSCPGGNAASEAPPAPLPALSSAPRARLRPGTALLGGRWLKIGAAAPGPGRLRLSAELEGRAGGSVCSGRKEVAVAGPALLACRLVRSAHRALDSRPLKLNAILTFTPPAGTAESVSRIVRLSRR